MPETDPAVVEDSISPNHVVTAIHDAAESRRLPRQSFDRQGRGINEFLVQQVIGLMKPTSTSRPNPRRSFPSSG
jgi:hypothetical protein